MRGQSQTTVSALAALASGASAPAAPLSWLTHLLRPSLGVPAAGLRHASTTPGADGPAPVASAARTEPGPAATSGCGAEALTVHQSVWSFVHRRSLSYSSAHSAGPAPACASRGWPQHPPPRRRSHSGPLSPWTWPPLGPAAPPRPAPSSTASVRWLHGSGGSGSSSRGGGEGPATRGPRPLPGAGALDRDEELGPVMEVFDRPLKALQRDRAAALQDPTDPLLGAVSERLLDRLEDCKRAFPTAVVLGGAALSVVGQLAGGRAGIERVIVVDPSPAMLQRIQREEVEARRRAGAKPWPEVLYVRGDKEHLPLQPRSVDLIISCLGLHWANDLPGAMAQCRAALVPDGLFLSAVFGGDTLQEMRISCALAQMEREGGVSAVVSPLAQVRDAGNLLTRADLRLPSVDVDSFRIGYPSPMELVHHLRALGESNAASQRRRALTRDSALAAAAVYQTMFRGEGEPGTVAATYQVIFMTGWSPAANQPKAAKRGSATVSFQDLADGLIKDGTAIGGTADGEIVTPEPRKAKPPPSPPPTPLPKQ